ncbi:hypothetical protein HX049_13590 [Myroides odoratimimus]|uniref:hypothetical protein n=1 Tax=Myroides odoratimimus TaxID=76832 RepID=UPI002575629B|nr:hypothetical protein [Myroides odoratimimus]MDM1398200.1 hypothetical protein [Myroides odoratimimus]
MRAIIILIITCVVSLFIFLSCQDKQLNTTEQLQPSTCLENLDGSITIQGRITVKNTNDAPLGVTSVNIKNKWAFSKDITKFIKEESPKKTIAYGENERTFINKNGYYHITINKNDTLSIIPISYLYKTPKDITGLTKSQILNIELEPLPQKVLQDFEKNSPIGYKTLSLFLQNVNPDSLVTVSGTIYKSTTGTPSENIYVITDFLNNTKRGASLRFTDKHGQFNIKVPKNSSITIDPFQPSYINLIAKNDTVVNLKL